MEMSFVNREQVYREMEGMFNHVLQADRRRSAHRMAANDATPKRCAATAPTNRTCVSAWNLQDLSSELKDTDFAPFATCSPKAARSRPSSSKAMPIIHESRLDELQEFVKRYGADALAWIKLGADGATTSVAAESSRRIEDRAALPPTAGKAEQGDAVLIVAGQQVRRRCFARRA